jgi:myo-inositol-1(or 4)-monophosphatase
VSAGQGTDFVSAAQAIAREAGELLMGYFARHVKIEYKGDVDLVTEADRASEALIIDRLQARFPRHDVMGEEGARRETGSEYKWYVDPLDGTTNFAHGFPVFCVSMGLEHKGQVIIGIVYDPSRGEMFSAEKGSGAYLNQHRIDVSKTSRLSESLVATGFPSYKRHKNPNIHFYHQITLRTHGVRRAGSAALDLASVASGRFDGFWEFNLNPWDLAAGVLLVQEAGGEVTGFYGQPFLLEDRDVVATNGLVHVDLLREFKEIFAGRGMEPLPDAREYAKSHEPR